MPVGCLGNAARGAQDEEPFLKNGQNFETILTSSRLNSSDQFAFMQQTLLHQIFRISDESGSATDDPLRSSPSSSSSDDGSILCPTCVGFSDQCCRNDSFAMNFSKIFNVLNQNIDDGLLSLTLGLGFAIKILIPAFELLCMDSTAVDHIIFKGQHSIL